MLSGGERYRLLLSKCQKHRAGTLLAGSHLPVSALSSLLSSKCLERQWQGDPPTLVITDLRSALHVPNGV